MLRIALAGRVGVVPDGGSFDDRGLGNLGRLTLAYLVTNRHRAVARDELASVLWGDDLPATWETAIRGLIGKARALLVSAGAGEQVLTTAAGAYELRLPDDVSVDLEEASRAVADAEELLGANRFTEAERAALPAAAVLAQPFLASATGVWVEKRQAELREMRLRSLEAAAAAALGAGDLPAAMSAAQEAISIEPYRESAHLKLMSAHEQSGNRGEALRAYERCRAILAEELGVNPSARTDAAYMRLLGEEPTATAAPPQVAEAAQRERPPSPIGDGVGLTVVLFSDVVSSTEQRVLLGEDVADQLAAGHERELMATFAEHGGRMVKGMGDGAMAVFPSASGAIEAAIAVQQLAAANRAGSVAPLSVRIGIAAGEVSSDGGDVRGLAVVEAARLCAAAPTDGILVADLVWALAARRIEVPVRSVGALGLKGLPDPLPASIVEWQSLPMPGMAFGLPAGVSLATAGMLVGRAHEQGILAAGWEATTAGRAPVVVLQGEPGIGKTSLAADLARDVAERAGLVLYGRCDAELSLPHQPFVEAVREAAARSGGAIDASVADRLAATAAAAPTDGSDHHAQRHQMFEEMAAWLQEASTTRPVLFVLDDLHWATRPTLLLLRHLVRSTELGRVMIVGTYRDTELGPHHPLTGVIASLRREQRMSWIALRGLVEDDVRLLLGGSRAGVAPRLVEETRGNPFFLGELIRHLDEGDEADQLRIPESVRDVVADRVDRLGGSVQAVLAIAAVVGSEFDSSLVAALAAIDEHDVFDALERAASGRLVVEVPGAPGRYRFEHAVVRSTLYERITGARRSHLHLRVAEAIESQDDERSVRLVELAHHHEQAAGVGQAGRAIELLQAAGDQAMAAWASDEAVVHYERARDLIEVHRPDRDDELARALIRLGRAQRWAGRRDHRTTLLAAGRLARRAKDGQLVAEAALANSRGNFSRIYAADWDRVELLEAALRLRPEGDDRVTARLMATLAAELLFTEDADRRDQLGDGALAMARRVGDQRTLSEVLSLRETTISPISQFDERLAASRELVEIAERLGDPSARFAAYRARLLGLFEAGAGEETERVMAKQRSLAEEVPRVEFQYGAAQAACYMAILHGELEEAERLANVSFQRGRASGQPDAVMYFGAQTIGIRRAQGRLVEMADMIRLQEDRFPANAAYVARQCFDAGDLDGAAERWPTIVDCSIEVMTAIGILAGTALACRAYLAARLGDELEAARLVDVYEPHAERLFNPLEPQHAGAHFLGMLCTTLRRWDDADRWFALAERVHTRLRAPILLAETRVEWAASRMARREVDAASVGDLLTRAVDGVSGLGAGLVEARAAAVRRELTTAQLAR